MKRMTLEPAYVLHRRAFRETSFLVEIFSEEHGRLTLIARGVRKLNSKTQGLLQPFVPLLLSFAGKGELMTLSHAEVNGEVKRLQGNCLFAGFYLNELLMALLQKWDPHPNLYTAYERTLFALQDNHLEQKFLRSFEKYLLEELGYGLLPKSHSILEHTFSAGCFYRFIKDQGFVPCESADFPDVFSGKSLLAIAKENWQDESILKDARRLMRLVLSPLLGVRPIHSRRLFLQQNEGDKNES